MEGVIFRVDLVSPCVGIPLLQVHRDMESAMAQTEAKVVREDQRSVTQSELLLVKERLETRMTLVEAALLTKASEESVEHMGEKIELKLDHLSAQQARVERVIYWVGGAIGLAVIGAVMKLILVG